MFRTPTAASLVAIDDNPDDLVLLERLLARAGVTAPFICFKSSRAALAHLLDPMLATLPYVILVDGHMPEFTGFDVVRAVRGSRQFDGTAILMLSGSEKPEDAARAIALGADGYLVKFPAPDVLASALASHVPAPASH